MKALAILTTLLTGCGGAMPDMVVGDTRFYLMTADACLPAPFVHSLERMRYNLDGAYPSTFNTDVEMFDASYFFDDLTEETVGLHWPKSNTIQLRYPAPQVLAHELAHRVMHLSGRGNTRQNREHGPEFQAWFARLADGLPGFDFSAPREEYCE